MKAVIVDRRDKYAVVFLEDGTFEKILMEGESGTEIELTQEDLPGSDAAEEKGRFPNETGDPVSRSEGRIRKIPRTFAALSAAAAIILAGFGMHYYYSNVQSAATITLGSGSAVTFEVNRQDEVIRVTAADRQAQAIVDNLKSQKLDSGKITEVLDHAQELIEEAEPSEAEKETDFSVESKGDPEREERIRSELSAHFKEKSAMRAQEDEQPDTAASDKETDMNEKNEDVSEEKKPDERIGDLSAEEKPEERSVMERSEASYAGEDGQDAPDDLKNGASGDANVLKDAADAVEAEKGERMEDEREQMPGQGGPGMQEPPVEQNEPQERDGAFPEGGAGPAPDGASGGPGGNGDAFGGPGGPGR